MTLNEAEMIEARGNTEYAKTDEQQALTVLRDALREAQAQTVQMREVVRHYLDDVWQLDGVRLGPVEPYDRPFDAVQRLTNARIESLRALFSPAPAVAPVAQKHDLPECDDCDGKGGFDGYGKPSDHPSALRACESCDGTGRVAPVAAPNPVAFDAEAAMAQMLAGMDREINMACHGRSPITTGILHDLIAAGLAAGRGAR